MIRPLAGTRPRGKTPEEDAALEKELRNDEKERAEHIMLVDLGRNDIGRVSQPGTVAVSELMEVERYPHVMHLVTNVQGKLRPEMNAFDALRACFPAGTVSSAPKVRVMEIIAEFKPEKRGPYAGAAGILGQHSLDIGHDTQVRMDVQIVGAVVDGQVVNTGIEVPSNTLRLISSFDIKENQTTMLTIDFDAAKSLVFTGQGTIIFKPTVTLSVEYPG